MTNYLTGRTIFAFISLCLIGYKTYQWYKRRNKTPVLSEDVVAAAGSSYVDPCKQCLQQSKINPPYPCILEDDFCAVQPGAIINVDKGTCSSSAGKYKEIKWDRTKSRYYCEGWGRLIATAAPTPQPACQPSSNTNTHPIITSFCPLSTTNNINPRNKWKACKILHRNNEDWNVNQYQIKQTGDNYWGIRKPNGHGFAPNLSQRRVHRFTNCNIKPLSRTLLLPDGIRTTEMQWCNIEYWAGSTTGCDLQSMSIGHIGPDCFKVHDVWHQHKTNKDAEYAILC